MINLLKELTKEFRAVTPESFLAMNNKSKVVYPYLTYDLSGEHLEANVEGFYVDVDIFDKNSSYVNIFTLEENLKKHFKDNRKLTDDLYVRFKYLRSNNIDTRDEELKRRNLQFYCKVDWRNK